MDNKIKTALTIAGSDSSGGAGIQADIKTMMAHKVYAMSAITSLTAQNTLGVTKILNVSPEFLKAQLDAVFTDIFPDAVKIGMVPEKELVIEISKALKEYKAKNIVLDPVMVATSGAKLTESNAVMTVINELFPLSTLITPNIPEAQAILNEKICSEEDMEKCVVIMGEKYEVNILLKGGHLSESASDLLYENGKLKWLKGKRIKTNNTHGTGCTLSSAIASNLALGYDLFSSVQKAKEYIEKALNKNLNLGKGSGPLNHCV